MKPKAVTCGRVRQLLLELGFSQKQLDDRYDVFHESETDMIFPFPRWSDDKLARESDVVSLRLQFHYRGLMEEADFDAFLSGAAHAKS